MTTTEDQLRQMQAREAIVGRIHTETPNDAKLAAIGLILSHPGDIDTAMLDTIQRVLAGRFADLEPGAAEILDHCRKGDGELLDESIVAEWKRTHVLVQHEGLDATNLRNLVERGRLADNVLEMVARYYGTKPADPPPAVRHLGVVATTGAGVSTPTPVAPPAPVVVDTTSSDGDVDITPSAPSSSRRLGRGRLRTTRPTTPTTGLPGPRTP